MSTKKQISILIPVFNASCVELVKSIQQQARQLDIDYEIIVADDGSTQRETTAANDVINQLDGCRYIRKEVNTGSAATRNFLAQQSRYDHLLFLDSDLEIANPQFLANYLPYTDDDVVNGGISFGGAPEVLKHNLRYQYERREAERHDAQHRSLLPYQSFRSCNFLIKRQVMLQCPFDERFKRSGYEDVLLGKQLRQQRIRIRHIDNPVMMTSYEENADYVDKTERNLRTLLQFRRELRGYSRLLTLAEGIHLQAVVWMITTLFAAFGPLLRRNLSGKRPRLKLFDLYRAGFFLSIMRKN